MGRFDKRFSVTGRGNQVSDFFRHCFLRNISSYRTIIFFFLADCFNFTRFDLNRQILTVFNHGFALKCLDREILAMKVAPFHEEFMKSFR